MTNEPTLEDCLHQVCGHCGEIFGMHRVTPTGNSYCLELTREAELDNKYLNREGAPLNLVRIKVSKLRRSPFGRALGQYVNGLLTYVEAPT